MVGDAKKEKQKIESQDSQTGKKAEDKDKEKNESQDSQAAKDTEDNQDKAKNEKQDSQTEKKTEDSQDKKNESQDSQAGKTAEGGQEKKVEIPEVLLMRSPYKFKALRTETRNLVFIKSNVPDPALVADAAMEIIIGRKTMNSDAVRQLVPVQGVCQNDHHQVSNTLLLLVCLGCVVK